MSDNEGLKRLIESQRRIINQKRSENGKLTVAIGKVAGPLEKLKGKLELKLPSDCSSKDGKTLIALQTGLRELLALYGDKAAPDITCGGCNDD